MVLNIFRLAFSGTAILVLLSMNVLAQSEPQIEAVSNERILNIRIPKTKIFNLDNPQRVPNNYIVVFKDGLELAKDVPMSVSNGLGVAPGEISSTTESVINIGLAMADHYRSTSLVRPQEKLRRIRNVYSSVFRGFSIDGVSEQGILELARDPRVKYVDAELEAHATVTGESIQTTGGIICNSVYPASCVPTPCQGAECAPWDLDRLDQVRGLDGKYHYYATGEGVTIWIIDTGLQFTHDDFGGRAGNSVIEFNTTSSQDTWASKVSTDASNDTCGHGTAVASAAAGERAGVANGATLRGINADSALPDNGRTTIPANWNCDNFTTTGLLIAAIDYVIANKSSGPNIINLSVEVATAAQGDSLAPSFETAVFGAISAGITFVTSVGNETQNACLYDPSRLVGVIGVGSTSELDTVSSFSNYSSCVSILAPGEHVVIADNGMDFNADDIEPHQQCQNAAFSNVGYCTLSGTSLAAPLVVGVTALYLQHHPTASPGTVLSALQSSAVSGALGIVPSGTANLLASVWVPGNSSGAGAASPGGGVPPGGAFILPTIIDLLLHK